MLRLITKVSQRTDFLQFRALSAKATSNAPSKPTSATRNVNFNVPGLGDKCVQVPNKPVGPGASKETEYKNPEYFCYHVDSFGEAEVELAKYRLPPPSNKVPFNR